MIKIIITDIDNTLYDWVDSYMDSFNAMVKKLSIITKKDIGVLKASFKKIHEKHNDIEYPLSLEELDIIKDFNKNLTIKKKLLKYNPAIEEFDKVQNRTLKLYDGVLETFEILKSKNKIIVGYTESMKIYTRLRLHKLKIEHYFDGLITQKEKNNNINLDCLDLRCCNKKKYNFYEIPFLIEYNLNFAKPSTVILEKILKHYNIMKNELIYIGNDLVKDIYMAKKFGIVDIYSGYGSYEKCSKYSQLYEITHWTKEKIEKEKNTLKREVKPSYTIECFSEIIKIIEELEKNKI